MCAFETSLWKQRTQKELSKSTMSRWKLGPKVCCLCCSFLFCRPTFVIRTIVSFRLLPRIWDAWWRRRQRCRWPRNIQQWWNSLTVLEHKMSWVLLLVPCYLMGLNFLFTLRERRVDLNTSLLLCQQSLHLAYFSALSVAPFKQRHSGISFISLLGTAL